MGNVNDTRAFASLQGTVSNTVLTLVTFGFTAEQVDQASQIELYVNTQGIRIDFAGNNPSTSVGALLDSTNHNKPHDHVKGNDNIQLFKMIRNGSSDSEVFIILRK